LKFLRSSLAIIHIQSCMTESSQSGSAHMANWSDEEIHNGILIFGLSRGYRKDQRFFSRIQAAHTIT
jgi:hypothetical protein